MPFPFPTNLASLERELIIQMDGSVPASNGRNGELVWRVTALLSARFQKTKPYLHKIHMMLDNVAIENTDIDSTLLNLAKILWNPPSFLKNSTEPAAKCVKPSAKQVTCRTVAHRHRLQYPCVLSNFHTILSVLLLRSRAPGTSVTVC